MDDTLNEIHRLAKERLNLYMLAGHQRLTQEQQYRIQEITNRLPTLWDRHRSEVASEYRYQRGTQHAA